MANLTPADSFADVVRLDVGDPVIGYDALNPGAGNGKSNEQAQALLDRTTYLRNRTGVQSTWDPTTAALPGSAAPDKLYYVSAPGTYGGYTWAVGDLLFVIAVTPSEVITRIPKVAGGGPDFYAERTGSPSVAPVVSGGGLFAIGDGSIASDTGAFSLGDSSTASNDYAMAVGESSAATGVQSTAVGYNTDATATYATAVGANAVASSSDATAVGTNSDATGGSGATAIGFGAQATGSNSVAAGNAATASSNNTVVVGGNASATAQFAIAVGQGAVASKYAGVALGSADPYNANEMIRPLFLGDNVRGNRSDALQYAFTLDATPTVMSNENNAFLTMANNATMTFNLKVAARQFGGGSGTVGDCAAWHVQGQLKCIGGTYTLVGSNVGAGAVSYSDAGAATWTIALATTGSGLTITVTGEAGKQITWGASLDGMTIAYG